MPLKCQLDKFSLSNDVHYLNCAFMSPLLNSVELVGVEELRRKFKPYEYSLDDFFGPVDEVKSLFGKLIHTNKQERMAIIPSVSYGLANAANNIKPKKNGKIVLVEGQFPSNYYIWKKKCDEFDMEMSIVSRPISNWSDKVLENININTSAVVMPQVHWADGTIFNLEEIGKRCREVGAMFIIDGTQSIGVYPFDVSEIKADAVICAGYKWLMGPYGIGMAYYGDYFDDGKAIEENWLPKIKSDEFAGLTEYQEEYRPMAWKYSVGECSNFVYLKMLIGSIKQLLSWNPREIQKYCEHITRTSIEGMIQMGCVISPIEERSSHLFGIIPPNNFNKDKFDKELIENKIFVSQRGPYYRVSPNVYNNAQNLNALKECFSECIN